MIFLQTKATLILVSVMLQSSSFDSADLLAGSLVFDKAARLLRDTVEQPASKVSATDKAIFKKFKAHYTACMDLDAVSEQGLIPLKNITEKIKDLMNKHDPMPPGLRTSLQVSTSAHEFDADALTDTLAFMTELGIPALVDFSVTVCAAYYLVDHH